MNAIWSNANEINIDGGRECLLSVRIDLRYHFGEIFSPEVFAFELVGLLVLFGQKFA